MLVVGAAVIAVWAMLLGAAWLCRGVLRLSKRSSLLVVGLGYVALAVLALLVIGPTGRGLLGAAGMLVPLTVASILVLRPDR